MSSKEGMPNRIDTPVNAMKAPATDSNSNLSARETGLKQLPPSNHPMLPPSQLRDSAIRAQYWLYKSLN